MPKSVIGLEQRRAVIHPREWTPALVYRKLAAVVPGVNQKLPPRLFLQLTVESDDDVPVVRVLAGPRDPYTAERIGSLAFYSTPRGLEWYAKSTGHSHTLRGEGKVYVTYFEDSTREELPALELSIADGDSVWADHIFTLFDL